MKNFYRDPFNKKKYSLIQIFKTPKHLPKNKREKCFRGFKIREPGQEWTIGLDIRVPLMINDLGL